MCALVSACASAGMDDDIDAAGIRADARIIPDAREAIDAREEIDAVILPPDAALPDAFTCVETGEVCYTGSPGECGAGHERCVDNAPTCQPDVTTQICYDGPVETRGVGACRDGTQSCVGTLGGCGGQVLPAAKENCFNNEDDDCDGRANEGCPNSVSVGAARYLATHGGGGGGPVSARCPSGSFVARADFHFTTDTDPSWAAGVRIYCAYPTLSRGASSYTIGMTAVPTSPTVTALGGDAYASPDGIAACTTGGLQALWTIGGWANTYVMGFGGKCATGSATLNADNSLSVVLTENATGGYFYFRNTDPGFYETCAGNEVVVGYELRLGSFMDQIRAVCAPLNVTYQ
jgi:hypothetical protein